MSREFSLPDSLSLSDLQVFLARASRVDDGSVRLIARGEVLAVYVGVLYPAGLLDGSPTVLGLRTFALEMPVEFDAVVPTGSLVARLQSAQETATDVTAPVAVTAPSEAGTATWAAISPPRGGWVTLDPADARSLELTARAGIDEVAASVPNGTGEQIVHRVRSEVWGRPIDGLEHVPAGAAFAAMTLGFLADDEPVRVLESGAWTRLSTERGHVLVKRRGGSPLG